MLRKHTGDASAARMAVDPELPAEVRSALRNASKDLLHAADQPAPQLPASPWWEAVAPVSLGGICAGVLWLLHRLVASRIDNEHPPSEVVPDLDKAYTVVSNGLLGFAVVVGGVGLVAAMWRVLSATAMDAGMREVHQAHGRYILPEELDVRAARLLARAQRAITAVLRSRVQAEDLIDHSRNRLQLPAQEWEIAQELRDYTQRAKRFHQQADGDSENPSLLELRQAGRSALDQSLAGITRRIEALEGYAAEVAAADRRYAEWRAEWRQVRELSDSGGELLELVARTARDDLAVAELENLTGTAATVTEALTQALDAAKDAAGKALPSPPGAA
ncbi:hypothetical protein G5C51_31695 [Streptomyces sp. A7024]|uniref:Uncharacterized protein n=1 Tax=Streptomyces coryli TaxID=1128680 RepID=A0A6G4UAN6_9ACTN|nr:hypothetical protein [Streptomyces coryli]NGN68448.1 hypothetical protein [Streptomyces coryli]